MPGKKIQGAKPPSFQRGKLASGGLTSGKLRPPDPTKTTTGAPRRRVEVGFKNLPPEGVRIVPITKAKKRKPEKPKKDEESVDQQITAVFASAGVWNLPPSRLERVIEAATVVGGATTVAQVHAMTLEILDASGNVLASSMSPFDSSIANFRACAARGIWSVEAVTLVGDIVVFLVPMPRMNIPPSGSARLRLEGWAAGDTTPQAFFTTRNIHPS